MAGDKEVFLLDSSVWIAYLNEQDSQHAKATQVWEVIGEAEAAIVITEYIVLEVSTVLSAKAGKDAANTFLDIALHNKDVRVFLSNEKFFSEAIRMFQKTPKNISFADASLLVLAPRYKIVTFDKVLLQELNVRDAPRSSR